MARVRSFSPSGQRIVAHPTETDCEYAVVDGVGGRFLHLSTFGSDDRTSNRKSSQSMQLDLVRAGELMTILLEAFPELRTSE